MASNNIYVAKIVTSTSADGPGLRTALYVQGCPIHCEGCHNSALWDIKQGKEMSVEDVYNQLMEADENISILGGEPLAQYPSVVKLCKMIKENTDKDIWLWSGFELDEIKESYLEILNWIDTLVDGRFIKSLADSSLLFRGSSNQRVIPISGSSMKGYMDYMNLR